MVASYSPHRHHGETATLFSRPPSKSPSRHLLHSPSSSCSSPFAIASTFTIKTRSASRRATPTTSRNGSPGNDTGSPVRFPLSLATHNEVNTIRMTLRSGSSSPRTATPRSSPREKIARSGRSTLCSNSPASRSSPLKRSDGVMNLDQASRGSPIAKRRSAAHGGYTASNSSQTHADSSDSSTSSTGSRGNGRSTMIPKRSSSLKKPAGHIFEKPSFVRSRPQARQQLDFSTSSDTNSRLRRVTSVENFVPPMQRDSPFTLRNAPLPSASAHPHRPHPLAQTSESPLESSQSSELETPQNYKHAKPNPVAFHSTGFVPKRGRMSIGIQDYGPQPDTPCKKSNLFPGSAFQSKVGDPIFAMRDLGSPQTPAPTGGNAGGLLDFYASTSLSRESSNLPPTPTKQSNNNGNTFTTNKRLRTEPPQPEPTTTLYGRLSPQTPAPKDNIVPPDPSTLSISGKVYHPPANKRHSLPAFPVTPAKDMSFGSPTFAPFRTGTFNRSGGRFLSKFTTIKHIGSGEFSDVYQVSEKPQLESLFATPTSSQQLATPGTEPRTPFSSPSRGDRPKTFAIKKSKGHFLGPRDRQKQLEEARILKELKGHDHVVEYVDSWTEGDRLFIQTEFCEIGSLDKFLEVHGNLGRLDEFRVWKITLELCSGLQHIHDAGFMHLDIKPANVLIGYDGSLKISDFGMAANCTAPTDELTDLEREGDREYIAPEVLHLRMYGKPVDIFALGLTIIEVAGNEALPPNGPEWQLLRQGDISIAPILSTCNSGEFVRRDENGNAITTDSVSKAPGTMPHAPRPGDLIYPPQFMAENGLERLVESMIRADPAQRPTATDLLNCEGLQWVKTRRRAPATIFEGLWGPDDAKLAIGDWDMEM